MSGYEAGIKASTPIGRLTSRALTEPFWSPLPTGRDLAAGLVACARHSLSLASLSALLRSSSSILALRLISAASGPRYSKARSGWIPEESAAVDLSPLEPSLVVGARSAAAPPAPPPPLCADPERAVAGRGRGPGRCEACVLREGLRRASVRRGPSVSLSLLS